MDCTQALEALSAQLDGELSPQEAKELHAHLDTCPTCRALARELSALHDACGGLEVAPPAGLTDFILSNLPAQEPVKIEGVLPKKTARRWQRWAAMAATFALVCMAAWQLPRFLFTHDANTVQEDAATEAAGASAPLELPNEEPTSFPEGGSEDAETTGGAPRFTVTGSGSAFDGETTAEETAQPAETPAEVPTQGALSDAAQADNGMIYSGSEAPANAEVNGVNKAQKAAPSASAASAAPSSPAETRQAALTDAAPIPQPSAAPAASPSVLLRSFSIQGVSQDTAAEGESAAEEDPGIVGYSDKAEDTVVSPENTLPQAGGSGSASQVTVASGAPETGVQDLSTSLYAKRDDALSSDSALTEEIPAETDPAQPYVDAADFEKVVPTAGLPTYCGEITLSEGKLLGDYPQEENSDGTVRCILPAHQFWALLRQLEESDLSYQFRRTGGHIDPASDQGLVILPAQ